MMEIGVRQEDNISTKLYILALKGFVKRLPITKFGINIGGNYINDLRFTDVFILITSDINSNHARATY